MLDRRVRLERLGDGATACDCTDALLLLDRTPSTPELDVLATKMQGFLCFTWNTLRHYCETGKTLPGQLDVESLVG